jgi:hypothetical protein
VHDDPELKAKDEVDTYSVAPIPATSGIGNPIHLQPGEEVPHPSTLTANTIDSSIKLDKESYEKSDSGAPQLPPVLTPGSEQEAFGAQPIFGLGPVVGGTFIPESSLPMGEKAVSDVGPTVSSVAPQSTTNELAGQQPILPRGVPEVVAESQEEAHVSPEAAANPEAVEEKAMVEDELKQKVVEEPAVAEEPAIAEESATAKEPVVAEEPAVAAAPVATGELAVAEEPTVTEEPTVAQEPTVAEEPTVATSSVPHTESDSVPQIVEESQEKAHVSPEAAANPEAVHDKAVLENELKEKVAEEPAIDESSDAPQTESNLVPQIVEESQEKAHVSPEAAANPEAVHDKALLENELKEKVAEEPAIDESSDAPHTESNLVPQIVEDSQEKANVSPEAAANPEAVQDKAQLEDELKQKVAEEPAAAESSGVPQVVEESQEEAHVSPEAAANPEAVEEKAQVEDELKQTVPEQPATTESGILGNSERGITGAIAGGAVAATAAVGTAAAAGAYALRQKATETTGEDPVATLPKSVQDTLPESVAGGATTSVNTDAAGLPLEPATVPHIVEESQEKAHVEPEAAANPEAVVEKADVEDELKQKVPEAPATAESGLLGKSEDNKGVMGALAGGVAAAGAAAAAGAFALNQKVTETAGTDAMSKLPKSIQDSINDMNSKGTTAPEITSTAASTSIPNAIISQDPALPQQTAIGEAVTVPSELNAPIAASGVPEEVIHSQQEAHVSPEAAANPEAVREKKVMEEELTSTLKPVESSGEPAPTVTAVNSATAPTVAPLVSTFGKPQLTTTEPVSPISMENATPSTAATALPNGKEVAPVAEVPAAAALTDVTNSQPTTGSNELNASADTPATTAVQKTLAAPEQATPLESRDVSPMSRVATKNHPGGTESGPIVTDGVTTTSVPAETTGDAPVASTGVDSSTVSAESSSSKPVGSRPDNSSSTEPKRASWFNKGTPESRATPESPKATGTASGAESQKKRRSFFGRLKDKLMK